MYQRLLALVMTMCSAVLFAYWFSWACLLVWVTDVERLAPILDREYGRLRRLCVKSTPSGALFLQWLDCRTMAAWYRVNRSFCAKFACDPPEDVVSALGRFGYFFDAEPGWSLARMPIARALSGVGITDRQWKRRTVRFR